MSTNVYEVLANSDTVEGRGPMVGIALFTNETIAWEYANSKKGIMGRSNNGDWRTYSGGRDLDVRVRVLHSCLTEVDNDQKRQRALQKLSREDLEILGL